MRLFLFTLFARLGGKISHTANGHPTLLVLWAVTVLTGPVFSVGHLPAATAMGIPLTPLFLGRMILLNLGGVVFGWLYWKHGLDSAIIAHFSTDIVLHVIGTMIAGA